MIIFVISCIKKIFLLKKIKYLKKKSQLKNKLIENQNKAKKFIYHGLGLGVKVKEKNQIEIIKKIKNAKTKF